MDDEILKQMDKMNIANKYMLSEDDNVIYAQIKLEKDVAEVLPIFKFDKNANTYTFSISRDKTLISDFDEIKNTELTNDQVMKLFTSNLINVNNTTGNFPISPHEIRSVQILHNYENTVSDTVLTFDKKVCPDTYILCWNKVFVKPVAISTHSNMWLFTKMKYLHSYKTSVHSKNPCEFSIDVLRYKFMCQFIKEPTPVPDIAFTSKHPLVEIFDGMIVKDLTGHKFFNEQYSLAKPCTVRETSIQDINYQEYFTAILKNMNIFLVQDLTEKIGKFRKHELLPLHMITLFIVFKPLIEYSTENGEIIRIYPREHPMFYFKYNESTKQWTYYHILFDSTIFIKDNDVFKNQTLNILNDSFYKWMKDPAPGPDKSKST